MYYSASGHSLWPKGLVPLHILETKKQIKTPKKEKVQLKTEEEWWDSLGYC